MFLRLWKSTDVGNFMQFRSVQMWGVSLIGSTTARHFTLRLRGSLTLMEFFYDEPRFGP
jgi:hypothetical protein